MLGKEKGMQSTKLKVGDKVRHKVLQCEAEILKIDQGNFGMVHIKVKTPYCDVWCFPHDLEEL